MQASINNYNHTPTTANSQPKKTMLNWGAIGDAVVELQKLLTHWGTYTEALDGIFDTKVEDAVKAFQHRVFLKEDGIVGQLTWQALYTGAPVNMPELRRGSQGETVTTLQRVLALSGDYTNVVDGIFSSKTEAAVRSFQRRCGLVTDGIVGFHTWHALSKVSH
jgi:peptidoglycan hydrolase-like protein with peptidoglycan-binding domain